MGGRQRPADFFEGLGIRPKGTVQEASRAVAMAAQEVLEAKRRDGAKAKAPLVDRLYVAIGVGAEDLGEVEVKEVRAALLEATALDEGGPEGPYEGLYERVEAAMARVSEGRWSSGVTSSTMRSMRLGEQSKSSWSITSSTLGLFG